MTLGCIQPPRLTDAALSDVLDGLADGTTLSHLESCPSCRQRFDLLQRLDNALIRRLARFDCPSSQQLVDYHASLLETDAAEVVQAHVTHCPRCQDELAMLESFIADEPPLVEVPRDDAPNVIRPSRLIWQAQLIDSSELAAARGLDEIRTYDARAGSATIYVEARQDNGQIALAGQVIDASVDWSGGLVEVWQAETLSRFAILDDLGSFQFQVASPSTSLSFRLVVTALDGIVLILEDLILT